MSILKFISYANRFLIMSFIEKKLFMQGILYSLIFKILVSFFPLKTYLPLLKNNRKFHVIDSSKRYRIYLANKTIKRMVKYAPWQCNCLIKSLTMRQILNSLGVKSSIILSISKRKSKLAEAHSYIKIDNDFTFFKKEGFYEVFAI